MAAFSLLVVAAASSWQAAAAAQPLPTAVQTAWQERELGGLITWGMNVPLANSSSKLRHSSRPTTGVAMCSGCSWQLDSLPPASEFDPSGLDVPGWVSAAKSFGARYLVLAVNHCGGFALWPSNATVPRHGRYNYSTASSTGAWVKQQGRDIVAQFVAECRRQDILPGFYVSHFRPHSFVVKSQQNAQDKSSLLRFAQGSDSLLIFSAGQHRRKYVPQYRCRCQFAQRRSLRALLHVPPQPAWTGQHYAFSNIRRGTRDDE